MKRKYSSLSSSEDHDYNTFLSDLVSQGYSTRDCVVKFLRQLKVALPEKQTRSPNGTRHRPNPFARYREWCCRPTFSPKNKEVYFTLLQLQKKNPALAEKIGLSFAHGNTELTNLTVDERQELSLCYAQAFEIIMKAQYDRGGQERWLEDHVRVVQQSIYCMCMLILLQSGPSLTKNMPQEARVEPRNKDTLQFAIANKEQKLGSAKFLDWFVVDQKERRIAHTRSKVNGSSSGNCLVRLTCLYDDLVPIGGKPVWNEWDFPVKLLLRRFETLHCVPLPIVLRDLCFAYTFGLWV